MGCLDSPAMLSHWLRTAPRQHPWWILEDSNWFVSLYAPYIWKSEQYIFMAIHTKGLHDRPLGQFKKDFPIRQHKCPQAVFQFGHHKKLQNILFPLRNKYCSRLCKKTNVVRPHWLKCSGHMEGICPATYLFFTREKTSQLLKVIMLMKTVMVRLRSFQSRKQQVVQPSMADPRVGRSKVVFECHRQTQPHAFWAYLLSWGCRLTMPFFFLMLWANTLVEDKNIKNKLSWIEN